MARLLVGLMVVAVCGAAGAELAIRVVAGVGDNVRPQSIAPIRVILENDEEERTGRVAVTYTSNGLPTHVWVTESLALPPQSRKSLFLYLPISDWPETAEARYETPGGRPVARVTQRLRALRGDRPVVLIVGRMPQGLPRGADENHPLFETLIMRPEDLPDRAIGLEMFDAIVFADPLDQPLPTDQVTALRDWTLRGGALVVDTSARTDAFRSGPLLELLPYIPRQEQQARFSVFPGEIMVTSGPYEGDALFQPDGVPLVIRGNLGLGTVTCFLLSPHLPELAKMEDFRSVWAQALSSIELAMTDPNPSTELAWQSDDFGDQLSQIVAGKPKMAMRLGIVLLLTALYALAVGPGDYFLVRRLGKPKLTWVTFPMIVAGFTAAAYFGARASVGGELDTLTARREVIFQDLGLALRFDLSHVFAPVGGDYELRDVAARPLRHISSSLRMEKLLRFDQSAGLVTQRIPIWTSRVFVAQEVTDDYAAVSARFEGEGPERRVVLTNHTDRVMAVNSLGYGGRMIRLRGESLAPDSPMTVALFEADGQPRSGSVAVGALGGSLFSGFYNFSRGQFARDPLSREFNSRGALDRGALIVELTEQGAVPAMLKINGDRLERSGAATYQIVYYGTGHTS